MNESNPFNLNKKQLKVIYKRENISDNLHEYTQIIRSCIDQAHNIHGDINYKFNYIYVLIEYSYLTLTGIYIMNKYERFRNVIELKINEIENEYDRLNENNKYLLRKIYINRV